MSAATVTPLNRLAKTVDQEGAPTRAELIRGADAALGLLAPQIAAHIAEKVSAILAVARLGDGEVRRRSAEVGGLAMGVIDLAVGRQHAAVGEVARGLTVVVDALERDGIWRWDVFLVHVDALRLVCAEGGAAKQFKDMADHLAKVRRAVWIDE